MSGRVVLLRHGQSEGNAADLFTGCIDAGLTELGRQEACLAGRSLASAVGRFDHAFTSRQSRAQETCALVLGEMGTADMSVSADPALNERDYGELTGLSKQQAIAAWGARHVENWRRSYAIAPPGGESLRNTGARVWLYYLQAILPKVLAGGNVLVVAHGNSLRALVMALETIPPDQIAMMEVPRCLPLIYRLDANSEVLEKHVLTLQD